MGIDLRRRNIVLASATAAALAPLAFARSAVADSGVLASVPTVDSLTIRVHHRLRATTRRGVGQSNG